MIANLAISDFLMGIYLMIVAAADVHYGVEYAGYDYGWRRSKLCTVAGFLTTFSGELSVATLTFITVDRFIVISLNSPTKKLSKNHVKAILLCIWVVVLTLCLVPCFDKSYFDNFYGQSEMCLPLPIASERVTGVVRNDDYEYVPVISRTPNGWEYSVFIFVGINAVSFLAILIMYVWMFISVKKTQAAARSSQLNNDLTLARKMTLIVVTDAMCWIPVMGLGIYSMLGNTINPKVSMCYTFLSILFV